MSDSRNDLIPPEKMERLILARQLELLSPPALVSVIGMPVWALIACIFASGFFKTVGQAQLPLMAAWFGLIHLVCAGAYAVDRAYRKAKLDPVTIDTELWEQRYSVTLAALSSVWASLSAVLGFSEIIASQAFGPNATEKYRDYAGDIHTSG